jgi:hypothetical protein
MFATARCASAIAVTGAILLGGASPALAADRMNDKPFTTVDFALTNIAPFAPIVKPTTFVAAAVAEPEPEKTADAPQMRPIDIAMPGAGAKSVRRSMYVSFAALQVMDAVSTSKALSSGASEANPVMSGLVKNKAAFYGIKAATAVSTIFFAERLGKNHPRRAAVVMAILNVGYAAIVAHNYRVASAR